MAALATNKIYAPNTVVFFRGDVGNSLYSIMCGRVRISAGAAESKEVFLNIGGPETKEIAGARYVT